MSKTIESGQIQVDAAKTRADKAKEIYLFNRDNLAPIEHLLISSTPDVNDQQVDVGHLLEQVRQGEQEALNQLLTPLRIQEDGKQALASVQEARAAERYNRELKNVPIFKAEAYEVLEGQYNIVPYLELNKINKKSGHVGIKWKIFLLDVNGNEIEDRLFWEGLDLNDRLKQWFSLIQVRNKNYRILELQLPMMQTQANLKLAA